MKRDLAVEERKLINGGAAVSTLCASGEKLYTCTNIFVGSDFPCLVFVYHFAYMVIAS